MAKRNQAPQLINVWQPITSTYHQAEVPDFDAVPAVNEGEKTTALLTKKSTVVKRDLPFFVACYAYFCFIVASVLSLGCFTVALASENSLSVWLTERTVATAEHSMFVRTQLDRASSAQVVDHALLDSPFARMTPLFLEGAAVLLLGVGLLWWFRSPFARWVTILKALYSVLLVAFYWTRDQTILGEFSLDQDNIPFFMMLAVDLLILGYLCYDHRALDRAPKSEN